MIARSICSYFVAEDCSVVKPNLYNIYCDCNYCLHIPIHTNKAYFHSDAHRQAPTHIFVYMCVESCVYASTQIYVRGSLQEDLQVHKESLGARRGERSAFRRRCAAAAAGVSHWPLEELLIGADSAQRAEARLPAAATVESLGLLDNQLPPVVHW